MRRSAAWLCVFAALLLAGCAPATDPFASYRGVNLIAGISLSKWAADQGAAYMTFEPVSAAAPSGGSTDVYRLEIRDLVPDGDFEQSAVGLGANGWTAINGGGLPDTLEVIDGAAAHAISGHTMHFSTNQVADLISFDLRGATWGARDGFLANATYNLLFEYRTDAPLVFEYHTRTSLPDSQICTWRVGGGASGATSDPSFDNLNEFPGALYAGQSEIAVDGESNALCAFGSIDPTLGQPQEAYIDNFRVVRTDIPCRARLLLHRQGDTSQPLLAGQYTFSVYVRSDPDVGTIPDRFASSSVSLGMLRRTPVSTDTVVTSGWQQAFQNGQDGLDFSSWTKLSIPLEAEETDPGNSATTLELSVGPTDDTHGAEGKDCGSILISSPSLELVP
ncbi:MAG: hypothetical protein ABSF77_17120 [Spirochaetia bacterium]